MANHNLVEASITDLQNALTSGSISSVELVSLYLQRISRYDCHGPTLNSVPILNLRAFEEAAASDDYRASGRPRRLLEGIPFTIKDSYKAKGLTVAAGSPAFRTLIANEDAFIVSRLRQQGAVLIGKTNMPPMALGGMDGLYGCSENPYNKDYLAAAFASGSSHGSGAATAASLGAFGMGEETVSSGRSPASNNGLVAYTPSKGLLSVRGNWPLYVTCDVIVPYTRTVADMFSVLDAIAVDDEVTAGDFWRHQPFVTLPKISEIRPASFHHLAEQTGLRGKRIGVPKMYINGVDTDPEARPVYTRPSVLDLWERARRDLEGQGAVVVDVDFPALTRYESKSSAGQIFHVPGIGERWQMTERGELIAYAWNDFLLANQDPAISCLSAVDQTLIYPPNPESLAFKHSESANAINYARLVEHLTPTKRSLFDIDGLSQACHALEAARHETFDDWLTASALDAIVFPAIGDVVAADIDTSEPTARHAWINGVQYANGNRALRHLGIPTVTLPMGTMADTRIPVGLTFAGKAYQDPELLRLAYAYEHASRRRAAPPTTPEIEPSASMGARTRQVAEGSRAPVIRFSTYETLQEGVLLRGKIDMPRGSTLQYLSFSIDGGPYERRELDSDNVWEVQCAPKVSKAGSDTSSAVAKDYTMVIVLARSSYGRDGGILCMVRRISHDFSIELLSLNPN